MSFDEKIAWKLVDNSVTSRMIDNSFIHKFVLSRIRKRTKILNTELKRYGVRNYKEYVDLKTTLSRNLVEDNDTDNTGYLSDILDYNIIYNNTAARNKYIAENTNKYFHISDEQFVANKNQKNKQDKNRLQTKHNTKKPSKLQLSSKKHINIGWQSIIKKNRNTLDCPHNVTQINASNDEENFFKGEDHQDYLVQSNNISLYSISDSEDNIISGIMKSENKQKQNNENSNIITNELSFQNDVIFSGMKSIVNNVSQNVSQNDKEQNTSLNESNIELQSLDYKINSSKSTNSETNIVLKLEDSNELTEINENSITIKNFNNIHVNRRSLENVRKNLISVLEETDSTNNNNKNIKKNETKNELNCDQPFLDLINSNTSIRSSTPLKKTQIEVINMQNSLSNTLFINQEKHCTHIEDLQNKFVEHKQSNLKSPTSFLIDIAEEILVSPYQCKKITIQKETDKLENSKQDMKETHLKYYDNDLENSKKQNNRKTEITEKFSIKMKNSSQLNQTDKNTKLIYSISQEDEVDKIKEDNINVVKSENSCNIQIQQLISSKKNRIKNGHLKSCDNIVEEENSKEVMKSKKQKINTSQLDKDKNKQISSINHEDKMQSTKPKDLYDSQRKQLPSLKKSPIKSKYSESNILKMQDNRKVSESSSEKEEAKNLSRCSEIDKNTDRYLINHKDEMNFMKSEDLYNTQKQQLPTVIYNKLINKQCKIINEKIDDIDNMEKIDNTDSGTNIINEDIPVKNNILMNSSINCDVDNWQKEMANTKEINDISMTLETDIEEDNTNYLSPQSKKRLQQQATLNLVVYSESSENDDDETKLSIESSKNRIDSSHINYSDKDNIFENDETTHASKKTDINDSCNTESYENIHLSNKETVLVSEEITESCSPILQEKVKKKTKYKVLCNNKNKKSTHKTQNFENIYNDKSSLLVKKNSIYNKNNQRNEANNYDGETKLSIEFSKNRVDNPRINHNDKDSIFENDETSHISKKTNNECKFVNESKRERSTTRNSYVKPDISFYYKPRNVNSSK
jgi:hypothetical protein